VKRSSTAAASKVRVTNPLGVHARPSARIVALASRFRSRVSLAVNGRSADARSIVAVMLLAANVGSVVSIEAVGPDAQEALDAMTSLISGSFDP
jgi:phosphocarrier protein HPr